jgi:hypothetical protein
VTAPGWISTLVAPDGRSAVVQLPRDDGTVPLSWLDLETLQVTPIEPGGDDIVWQRRAP